MKKTLGEICEIDSRKAARAVNVSRFNHDLVNAIAKYRAVNYKAERIVKMLKEMGAN